MQPLSTQLLSVEDMIGYKESFIDQRQHWVIVGVHSALVTTVICPVSRKEEISAGARAVPLLPLVTLRTGSLEVHERAHLT